MDQHRDITSEANVKKASFSIDSILSQKILKNDINNSNKDNNNRMQITEPFQRARGEIPASPTIPTTLFPSLISHFGKGGIRCDCMACEENNRCYHPNNNNNSLDDELTDNSRYYRLSPSPIMRDDSIEDDQYFFKDDDMINRYNKRRRTIFTSTQLERLEYEFQQQQYIVGQERRLLARQLGLNEIQVKVWFQNRRIKWRKFTSPDILSPTMPELSL